METRGPRAGKADGEESGLSQDDQDKGNLPRRRQLPFRFGSSEIFSAHVEESYSNFQSGSSGCFRSQTGRRLLTSGSCSKL